MKVCFYSFDDCRTLEVYVNNFIAYHNVSDIQYQASIGDHERTIYSVMIVYDDTGDKKGE